MGRAAVVIDIDAVGLAMDEIRFNLQAGKEIRGGGSGGAVGAVHQDPKAGQIISDSALQMLDVLILQVLHAVDPLADTAALFNGHGITGEDLLLHLLLQGVGEFVALTIEDLDAVVLKGVVIAMPDVMRRLLLLYEKKVKVMAMQL